MHKKERTKMTRSSKTKKIYISASSINLPHLVTHQLVSHQLSRLGLCNAIKSLQEYTPEQYLKLRNLLHDI